MSKGQEVVKSFEDSVGCYRQQEQLQNGKPNSKEHSIARQQETVTFDQTIGQASWTLQYQTPKCLMHDNTFKA